MMTSRKHKKSDQITCFRVNREHDWMHNFHTVR